MSRAIPVLLALAVILVDPTIARSQGVAGEWSASVKDSSQIALQAGIEAYREGALEVAVEALSDALDGKLTNTQRAEALYFRGLALRELRMPGQAVVDLSGAMAIKNGLSKARLKDAEKNRKAAAGEAGLTSSEAAIVTGALKQGARTAISVPSHRIPVPNEEPNQGVQPTAPPVVRGEPVPASASDEGILSGFKELIPSLF